MVMNTVDEASTSRIEEIILKSIHLSDNRPVVENMLFVEPCSNGDLPTCLKPKEFFQASKARNMRAGAFGAQILLASRCKVSDAGVGFVGRICDLHSHSPKTTITGLI